MNRVLYSPCMHLIHHSALMQHRDKNLGQVGGLALWDYLFGTLYIPDSREEFPFGSDIGELGSNNPHRSVSRLYVQPVKAALQTLRALAQTTSLNPAAIPQLPTLLHHSPGHEPPSFFHYRPAKAKG